MAKFSYAILLLISLTVSKTYAQARGDSSLELSKFEKFKSRTGKMFRTDHGHVGETKRLSVDIHRVIDLENGDSSKAIVIKQINTGFSCRASVICHFIY